MVRKSSNGNRIGRPSKLTPKIKEKLLSLIKIGTPLEAACKCCGLDYTTVREWVSRGKDEHPTRPCSPEYADFATAFEKAKGECEAILVGRISTASQKDWRAAAFMLRCRNPKDWNDQPKQTSLEEMIVSMATNGLINAEQIEALTDLSEKTKKDALAILLKQTQNAQP